ncbi:hypothetical protein BUALT_Bualt04G0133700 [Buddleja alternifolia]|uniref:non-specific serine/threonine protein kinase n=1 Tax=Buddleja alternifolia TaxID=168488 RepID=A0AAV6XT21_9LAMI|nr:hypothetical protein BUALT_Bualt04G0133700 [Buddleja alternifolia]
MILHPISIGLLFLCFLNTFTAGADNPTHFTGDVSINCGSSVTSAASNGREWLGDERRKFSSLLQIKGSSTTSSVIQKSISADPVPYKTARVSLSQFSYSFQVNQGQKILRLHFNPVSYRGFKRFRDLFTVEAGPFTLLSNFSASLTADALGVKSFSKEFCLHIEENQQFNIIFSSSNSETKDSTYAFINGIEIISVPSTLSHFHDIGLPVVGQKSLVYVENSTALEIIHRLIMKKDSVSSSDDFSDMFGMWGTVPKQEPNKINNITWKIPVDVGFRYLVRLHFSKLGLKMAESGGLIFNVVINEMIANTNIDMVKERDDSSPWYREYIVMMKGRKQEGKRDLLICLQSNDEVTDGPVKGFEIFKLSNPDNSLASPNPLPSAPDSPYRTIQNLFTVFGQRNVIVNIAVIIIAAVNIFVHVIGQIWEASSSSTEEENKPSARAERLCRRFSLAEIQLATRNFSDALLIGRGGFGKVYKGLIDNGRDTVAIKRLKSNSNQGAHEFLTEIETLSELRHVNLVSLIGYCNEQGAMILVYEYMACGTLADHLYKLARGSNSCSSLTWKQRLNICIGASRGLDYLHTGHSLIHRDVKASNILLDDNFIAKVSDFGLAKHENKGKLQSHVSTKVKGTYGYLDPYYFNTCKLTRKSDTYAFGVVLLEVLCGRPAMDPRLGEDERVLTKWARENISKGKVDQIVASGLRGEISEESRKTFVGVAERCLHDEPKKRPTMAQVVLQLQFALEQQESPSSSVINEITCDMDVIPPSNDEINSLVSSGQLTMASTKGQTSTPSLKEQAISKMVNAETPSGSKDGRKGTISKPTRLWPWEIFWNRVKPSKKNELSISEICGTDINLLKFEWTTILAATNSFFHRIEQGGTATLYKAVLPTGKTVAVKRIPPYSMTGQNEFTHEVLSLAKLRHHNIIVLLGYCIYREERILVYEFMENGSLDTFLSGLPTIHRRLTPSDILLDSEMNPKIAGIAKSFGDPLDTITTLFIVGKGYISPEYALFGQFSVKSDVYSFGSIVLEIVCGRRSPQYATNSENISRIHYVREELLVDPRHPWPQRADLACISEHTDGLDSDATFEYDDTLQR